jgi:hypothetical protein
VNARGPVCRTAATRFAISVPCQTAGPLTQRAQLKQQTIWSSWGTVKLSHRAIVLVAEVLEGMTVSRGRRAIHRAVACQSESGGP